MTATYAEFLATKGIRADQPGPDLDVDELGDQLHEWQRRIVGWAVHTKRAAIWADTGLGKTRMQLEWAWQYVATTNQPALVVAPLAVCEQTVHEGHRIGFAQNGIQYATDDGVVAGDECRIYVTNYERISSFDPSLFCAVVLDESSILKQSTGKMRTTLIDWAREIPARLACSATPAPNDPEELTNQAEWLGRMQRNHMLAAYFVHDQDGWRLKGHARGPMVEWMSRWAVAIRRPSDIGGDDHGYDLPGLDVVPELVHVELPEDESSLFTADIGGVTGRAQMRRHTLGARVARAAELVAEHPGPWLLWCGLNDEATALEAAIPGSVNVHGSLSPEEKAELLNGFREGRFDVLITKPSIASMGMNWQHCHRMAFVGLGDSYEQYYQAIRRCYRYGQTEVVQAHIVVSELESQIVTNVARKERQSSELTDDLIAAARNNFHREAVSA